MTSASTCVPQTSFSHHRHSRDNDNTFTTSGTSCEFHGDREDDLLHRLRPDPDHNNIQDGCNEESHVMHSPQVPRRTPVVVINEPLPYSSAVIESMRRKLGFFFMDPIQKWNARRQLPWKLLLQIVKVFLVTTQLGLFGTSRYSHINFYEDNKIALCNLFLKDWDPQREVEAYPPNQGPYAVYTKAQFYEHVDHIVNTYGNIREIAIGSYDYISSNRSDSPLSICKLFYSKAVVFGFNESYIFDSNPKYECLTVSPSIPDNSTSPPTFDSKKYFAENNFSIMFDRLISVEVGFSLRYILLKALAPLDTPDCYQFNVKVKFNNGNHDAITVIDVDFEPRKLPCLTSLRSTEKYQLEMVLLDVLNVIIIVVCICSLLLCSRAILRAQVLKHEAITFFARHLGKELSANDKLDFLNLWYVMIIINDVLIITGSFLKIQIDNKFADGDQYNVCSVLLGSGNLLVWIGVLRYFAFFPKYNILIVTMRRAVPDVLRFLICAMLMYFGFIFCGWLVLGPYHFKFRSLSSTAECLFALINGDDMFATFTTLTVKSGLIWWYCRIYMYTFITLFIYIVLSLFIAVIMDTYETIKCYYEQGFPSSVLHEFIAQSGFQEEDFRRGIFRQDSLHLFATFKLWFRKFCRRGNSERQPLLGGM